MATRFYLPSSGTAPLSSLAIHSYWDLPVSGDPEINRLPMFTSRQNTALTSSNSTWGTTASSEWCWWQFQSEPFASSHAIANNTLVQIVISLCSEAAATADSYMEFTLRTVTGDGSSQTHVLSQISALGTEFGTTAASRYTTDLIATGATIDAGDRLILEVGLYGQTPSLTNCVMRIGDPTGTTEHSGASGSTDDYVPWFEIASDLPIGVINSGDLQAQSAIVSGSATVTPHTFFASGALAAQAAAVSGNVILPIYSKNDNIQAQAATVSGYAYFVPGLYEAAKVKTVDEYTLTIDGVIIPMFGFTVTRNVSGDAAEVVVPSEYKAEIAAAVLYTIDIKSTDVYGNEDITEIFSGAPSTVSPQSRTRDRIRANGAGTYTNTSAVREIENVSYMTDDVNYYSIRGRIDERFFPGDVGMFGLQRININRVTFIVNQTQSFMELADVGQV